MEQLQHPNIVRYYGLEEQPGLAFMVVEFIEGRSLRNELGRISQPLTPPQAAAILEPVCDALQYAHDRGLLHCDVKPANILIERSGRVVLADFGIARWAESATTTFAGAGTPAYMSPEQCRGTGITRLSDIYSLSVTLYEMLTRDRPFVGDTGPPDTALGERVRWEHLNANPPSPRRVNPQIPLPVEQLILTGLSKDPEMRPQTPQQFYRQLAAAGIRPDRMAPWGIEETLLPARELGSRPAAPIFAPPVETSHVRPSRRPFLAALGAVAAMVLVFAVVLVLSGSSSTFSGLLVPEPTATPPPTATSVPSPTASATLPPTPEPTPTEVVVITPSPTPTPTLLPSNVYIEYILDASNSMMQSLGGKTRLEVARSALTRHWQGLQPQPNIGLRAFGHRLNAVDSTSCRDTEQLAPVSQGQVERLPMLVHGVAAQGMSPLSRTLVDASGDFTLIAERANALILIADGGDNCGENACQTVTTHREVGIRYPIYVVGLDVDVTVRDELTCIARVSGALYRDAVSEGELIQALDEFAREIQADAP